MIENTYHESIEATINSATQTAEEIEAEAESTAESVPAVTEPETEKPTGIAETIGGWLNSVTESGRELTENITSSVSHST